MRAAVRAVYRGRQFFGALRPRIDARLRAEALSLLSEPERQLFEAMTRRDRKHCLEVYRRLRSQGHEDHDLLTAALLHDVGKGRVALWHRVAYVLLAAGAPGLLARLAAPGEGPGWRQALHRCRHHATLGAELARRAGSAPAVIALIGAEEVATDGGRLAALQAADDTV